MKKALCFMLALVLLSSMWTVADVKLEYGDVTQDGTVNATDALMVLRFTVGKVTLNQMQKQAADVSADSAVNAVDALQILQYTVKIRNAFAAEFVPGQTVVSDALYSVPDLEQVNTYRTQREAYNFTYPVTLTQISRQYDGTYDVELDCALAYASGINQGNSLVEDWAKNKYLYQKDTVFGIMMPINRDTGEYLTLYPERGMKDVQTNFSGEYFVHSGRSYYMVPSETYIEYKWRALKSYLDTGLVSVVALEEPEFWNKAGYSEGYQEAYRDYYGEPWEDYDLSTEAMYKNQYFKAYMFYHAFDVLSSRIKENYPQVEVYLACHATLNYSRHGAGTCLAMIASLDTVDGIIAQTWSDGATMDYEYAGLNKTAPFMTSLYEYNSYGEVLSEGQKLYLLQDPATDNPSQTEEVTEELWNHTVVASMMQNDTAAFETPIWPHRCFGPATDRYKTIQLNVQRMFNDMHQYDPQIYGGTPGVAFAMSDSAGWHIWPSGYIAGNCRSSCTGIIYPILEDGVPIDTVWLDNLTTVDQLADVNLLILTYDVMKPLSRQANQVIAQWVKEGGRLLYMGGTNSFDTIPDTWWGDAGVTPLEDLIQQLGLSVEILENSLPAQAKIQWPGTSSDGEALNRLYVPYTLSFDGSGFKTFMTVGGRDVGIVAPCQKGQVTMVGLPACYYAASKENAQLAVDLTELSLKGSNMPYYGSSVYAAKWGNYFGVYSMTEGNKLNSQNIYLDLFDSNLSVKQGISLQKDRSYLLYDITEAMKGDAPQLAFTGGTLIGQPTYQNGQTVYTMAAPTNSTVATAIACNGKEVDTVTAVDTDGTARTVTYSMDQGVLTLHATVKEVKKPVTVTVTWK